VNWGSAAHEASGGSRAAQYMLFDQAIREVREPGSTGPAALLLPEGRAALKAYLAGGRVVFYVQRASDIREVVRFAKARGMKPVIAGGAEAWVVARELADAGVPVILDPLENLPNDFDRLGARFDNAKILHEAGVHIAISQTDSFHLRKNRQLAGNAVAHGLPWDAGLAAITSSPAEIFGVGGARGRIEKGQAADLVLWSGDPLEVTTVAEHVWIAGNPVTMRSRQTELRDRYLERLRPDSAR
jgi:imidazolonepropionase-like amidohydrolase